MLAAAAAAVDVIRIADVSVQLSRPSFDGINPGADTTGLRLWPAAIPLAMHLHRKVLPELRAEHGRPLRLLELGAGRGLVGLSVAALSDDVTVVLTDDPQAVVQQEGGAAAVTDVLRENIGLNEELTDGRVSAARLAWGDERDIERVCASGGFDLIFGSDLLYEPAGYVPLLATIERVSMSGPDRSDAIIAYSSRHEGEDAFFSLATRSFEAGTARLRWPRRVAKPADGNAFIVPLERTRALGGGVRAVALRVLARLYGRRKVPRPQPPVPLRDDSDEEWAAFERSVTEWASERGSAQSSSDGWRFAGVGDYVARLSPRRG